MDTEIVLRARALVEAYKADGPQDDEFYSYVAELDAALRGEPGTRIMLQVGVEGDLFDPHLENTECASQGCRPQKIRVGG
jgi:hypothetical protein